MLCSADVEADSTYQDLVEEILNELFLQRARGKKAVQVGAEQLGDLKGVSDGILARLGGFLSLTDIHVLERRDEDITQADDLLVYVSDLLLLLPYDRNGVRSHVGDA